MAVLSCTWWVAAAAVTGCYGPELADCVVRCASSADCAPGQGCGKDRRCASPAMADRCADAAADAAVEAPADPPPDPAWLDVKIDGKGAVVIDGATTCSHAAPDHRCTLSVPAGVPTRLDGVADPGHRFDKWTSKACEDQGATCVLTLPPGITTVTARFRADGKGREDDD